MRILICHEHHGPEYHAAGTEEQLNASALAILCDRFRSGDYYEVDELEDGPAYTAAALEPWPKTGEVYKAGRAELDRWRVVKREHELACQFLTRVRLAVDTGNGPEAWRLLKSRSGYSDERVELRDVTEH